MKVLGVGVGSVWLWLCLWLEAYIGMLCTWRAADTENPTRPALRWSLLSTAHMAATNTRPFPRSSRFVASHLQRESK